MDDRFRARLRYSTLAIAYGNQVLKREEKTVDINVGRGDIHGENSDSTVESGMNLHGAAWLRRQISPSAQFARSAQFAQTVDVERGTANVRTVAAPSLGTRIDNTWPMKAAFSAQRQQRAGGREEYRHQTSPTPVYAF